MSLIVENKEINNSTHVKFLGVKIDSKLSFNIYIDGICKKAGLKVGPFKKKNFICFSDSPSKMMKNVFYFILKALFVLKIFKFLYWLFGHVEKTAWLER